MDAKRIAMVIAIVVLLPLFVGLFTDAVYDEPKYEDYCNNSYYEYSKPMIATPVNCTDVYSSQESQQCYNDKGTPDYTYDSTGCQQFKSCNYCSRDFNDAQQKYNRNIFFILLPLGLIIVIIGIYFAVDYLGAGLMFAGLIVMFYATFRYFSDMSKMLRAIVILVELLVIMWIGYQKIERKSGPFDSMRKLNKSNKPGKEKNRN